MSGRRVYLLLLSILAVIAGLMAPASAQPVTLAQPSATARPLAPYPACGSHFQLSRSGSSVTVVGVNLNAFSSGYMLVFASANGRGFGPYNASPYGGARFTINTGSSSRTTVGVSLTDSGNRYTLCSDDYYV